jgi:hypothetical protein
MSMKALNGRALEIGRYLNAVWGSGDAVELETGRYPGRRGARIQEGAEACVSDARPETGRYPGAQARHSPREGA